MKARVISAFRSVSYARAALLGALLLLLANVGFQPSIANRGNWAPTVAVAAAFILTSMAQAPAFLSGGGGIDLSVGPLAGLVSVLVVKSETSNIAVVLAIALGVGLLSGLIIGFLVGYVRIPPIIATLGAYLFYSGLAIKLLPTPGGKVPSWLTALAGNVGPLPGMWILFLAVTLLWVALMRTAFRRNLFAVGGDARAAHTAGINVALVRCGAYVLSGVLSATAGLAFLAVLGSADANAAPPYTMISLAGAALGGVSLLGGRGGLLGAAAGGAILFLIQNLLGLAQVSVFSLQIAYGLILLVALALNSYSETRRKKVRGGMKEGEARSVSALTNATGDRA